MNRRTFLSHAAAAATAASLPGLLRANPAAQVLSLPKGKAEHCIFIWLGGGMSQIDTFDPKKRGSSKTRVARNTIYCEPGRESQIVLPIANRR